MHTPTSFSENRNIFSPLAFSLLPGVVGSRLDAAISRALPGLGVRARRRLWEWCEVFVNGRKKPAGFIVKGGEEIRIVPRKTQAETNVEKVQFFIVESSADFVAFAKPAGLHSAHIAGGPEPSLESRLAREWPALWRQWSGNHSGSTGQPPETPQLLTRLDKATSGLLLAALSTDAAGRFRDMETEGQVGKDYFAVVHGSLERSLTLVWRLLTDGRDKTTVLEETNPDRTRHTLVEPLRRVAIPDAGGSACTLVRACIKRGARHQIRAHLAHAGFPILGEQLYAPGAKNGAGNLYLHHARLVFPGFNASFPPQWPGLDVALLS